MANNKKELTSAQQEEILSVLKTRFEKNMDRHKGLNWNDVEKKISGKSSILWTLNEMELTGGEPDVVLSETSKEIYFFDCSKESPKDRRSLCYDRKALDSRKEHKPRDSAKDMAEAMGVEMMTEAQFRELNEFGPVDTKTSSWLETPDGIRKLGGAIFGDYRYGMVFIYHNGADSYYGARGFRGTLKV